MSFLGALSIALFIWGLTQYQGKQEIKGEHEAALTQISNCEQRLEDAKAAYNRDIDEKQKEINRLHKENEKLRVDLELAEAAIKANQEGYCGGSDRP